MAKELTLNLAFARCKELFPSGSYYKKDALDKAIAINERSSASGPYAIRIRNRVEADEELQNLSADDIAGKKLATVTLLERVLFELKYFKETGNHLDIQNVTLCSVSRDADGHVPDAHWRAGQFEVRWYHSASAHGYLRSRTVSC